MRLLLALMATVGVLAAVSVSGVYATFSDSGTASGGPVAAGTVDIEVGYTGSGPWEEAISVFSWDILAECVASNLASGAACQVGGIGIRNNGSLTFDYVLVPYADPVSALACFTVTVTSQQDAVGTVGRMPPGDVETFGMQLVLDGDNACQGITANVGLTLVATQAVDPHSTVD
jgi:predicted ribosomally synthesized peptide with SipW-like signal peptide